MCWLCLLLVVVLCLVVLVVDYSCGDNGFVWLLWYCCRFFCGLWYICVWLGVLVDGRRIGVGLGWVVVFIIGCGVVGVLVYGLVLCLDYWCLLFVVCVLVVVVLDVMV